MTVVVVIPSRGRPHRAWEAVDAASRTAAGIDTEVWLVVDRDDPKLDDYLRLRWHANGVGIYVSVLETEATGSLVKATNSASLPLANDRPDAIIGNLGDDHLCRTLGWDVVVETTLERPGIAYGNDLLQGERLPTAPFISASIVRALGWYALPTCKHMFIDDAWKAIGNAVGVLRYVPDLIIEHVHPATGAVPSDEGYVRADSSMEDDRRAFLEWQRTTFAADVENVRRAVLGVNV